MSKFHQFALQVIWDSVNKKLESMRVSMNLLCESFERSHMSVFTGLFREAKLNRENVVAVESFTGHSTPSSCSS